MNTPLLVLGLYMLAMAVTGYVRTGSPTALYIMGGIGVVTAVMSWLVARGGLTNFWIGFGWTAVVMLTVGFMAVKRISAHADARPGSVLIFASTAIAALIVLYLLWRSKPSA